MSATPQLVGARSMRLVLVCVFLSVGACATREASVHAGHPADPSAKITPAPPSLGVLGSAFSPDALMPAPSGAPDPHEHHKHHHGGHEH